MAIDPVISEQLSTLILTGAQNGSALTQMADRNLVQLVGQIGATLLQQHGSTQDDPALFAALQGAAGVPHAIARKDT